MKKGEALVIWTFILTACIPLFISITNVIQNHNQNKFSEQQLALALCSQPHDTKFDKFCEKVLKSQRKP